MTIERVPPSTAPPLPSTTPLPQPRLDHAPDNKLQNTASPATKDEVVAERPDDKTVGKSKKTSRNKSSRPKPPLIRRLLRAFTLTTTAALSGVTLLGALAYISNKDVLHHPITAGSPIEAVPPAADAPARTTAHAATPPTTQPAPPPLSDAMAAQLFNFATHSTVLETRVAQARQQIAERLQHIPAFSQQQLLDVQAPLPSGDQAFIHAGPVNLPSLGWHDLRTESIPLSIDAHFQPGALTAHADVEPVHLSPSQRPSPPPGTVYLGSYRTAVYADADSLDVSGKVDVRLDLDGQGTKQALAHWRDVERQPHAANQDAAIRGNVERLEARLAQGDRLRRLGIEDQFGPTLRAVLAEQGSTVETRVPLSRAVPLVDGMHHLWLGTAPDGTPRVVVTAEVQTPGLDGLSLQGTQVQPLAHTPGNWPTEKLHGIVSDRVQSEVRKQLDSAASQMPGQVHAVVTSAFEQTASQIQSEANQQLQSMLSQLKHTAVDVEPTEKPVPPTSPTSTKTLQQPSGAALQPTAATSVADSPSALRLDLDRPTLDRLVAEAQQTPAFKGALTQQLVAVQHDVDKAVADNSHFARRELLDVHVKPPPDLAARLPGAELTLPVVVDVSGHVEGANLRVAIQPNQNTRAQRSGETYVASFDTTVTPEGHEARVQASITIRPDLDGAATRERLAQWRELARGVAPHSERGRAIAANIASLQKRLATIDALQHLIEPLGLRTLPEEHVDVAMNASLPPDEPLLVGTHQLWVGPHGRADVTDEVRTPGLDHLTLGTPQVTARGKGAVLPGTLQQLLDAQLKTRVQEAVASLSGQARDSLRERARAAWNGATPALTVAADRTLAAIYEQIDTSRVRLPSTIVRQGVPLHLHDVQPTTDGGLELLLGVRGEGPDVSGAAVPADLAKLPGDLAVLSGASLNAALCDQTDGGVCEWQPMLDQIARSRHLKSLTFDRDASGRLMAPQLFWRDGQPFVTFEVTAEMDGLHPASGLAGVADGATGALNDGTAKLKDGLGHAIGPPGQVVGTAVQAPFWLLHQLTGGVRGVVDVTLGKTVDQIAAAGTRPVVSVRLEVPLRLSVQDGVLRVEPQAQGLKVENGRGTRGPTLFPTQLIQSLVAQQIARSEAAREPLRNGVSGMGVNVDLRPRGVEFVGAETGSGAGQQPDIFVKFRLTDKFALDDWRK